jgi:hypothetical protein
VVPGRTGKRQHPILNFEQADNFAISYYAAGQTQAKGLPFSEPPSIEPEPGAWREAGVSQVAIGDENVQTNIENVSGSTINVSLGRTN